MKDIFSLEKAPTGKQALILARHDSISQEEDKVIDTKVQTTFLRFFASLLIDVMNQKFKIAVRKLVPTCQACLIENPSLTDIAYRLSSEYPFIPKNLGEIREIIKGYFETQIPSQWFESVQTNLSKPLVDLKTIKQHLITALPETLCDGIVELIFRTIPRADTVHILNDSLSVRRLDSLARLLALDKDISVCASVGFLNRKVIIGSNNSIASGVKSGEPICQILINRLMYIRSFIKLIHQNFDLDELFDLYNPDTACYQERYGALLQEFCHQLRTEFGGTQFANETLFQAVTKLIYSSMEILPQEFCLGAEDRFCLLESLDIVALTVTPRSNLKFPIPSSETSQVWLLMAKMDASGAEQSFQTPQYYYLPLNERNEGHLSKFHAEQLNAFYVLHLEEHDLSARLEIGVSKLCCPKCHQVLAGTQHFSYRGHHNILRPEIVNVLAAMPNDKKLYDSSTSALTFEMESSFISVNSELSSSSTLVLQHENEIEEMGSLEHSFESDETSLTHSFSDSISPFSATESKKRKSPLGNFFNGQASSSSASTETPSSRSTSSEALSSNSFWDDSAFGSPIKRKKPIVVLADNSPFLSPGVKKFLAHSHVPTRSFKTSLSFEKE